MVNLGVTETGQFFRIPLEKIKAHKNLLNRTVKPDLAGLIKSITSLGLIEPIGVLVIGGDAYRVVGETRVAALKKLRSENPALYAKKFKDGVPCMVITDSLIQAAEMQLAENIQRQSYSHVDVAKSIQSLRSTGRTAVSISKSIGKSSTFVRNYVRFSEQASPQLIKKVGEGVVDFKSALVIMKKDKGGQKNAIDSIEEAGKIFSKKEKDKTKRKIIDKVRSEDCKKVEKPAEKTKVKKVLKKKVLENRTKEDMRDLSDKIEKLSTDSAYANGRKYTFFCAMQLALKVSRYCSGDATLSDVEDQLKKFTDI